MRVDALLVVGTLSASLGGSHGVTTNLHAVSISEQFDPATDRWQVEQSCHVTNHNQ